MKWCVDFPEETMLIVRPCLKRICLDNKPAAKLLSVLLYRYSIRKEAAEDAENLNEVKASEGRKPDQDTSFCIYRKQSQLVADMVDEIDEKTLHNVAVPLLQMLGYLDIEERPGMNCYTVHLDRVIAAMAAYKQGVKALEAFLLELPQLEKVLIGVRLDKFLINKKNFLSELEKVLIANRNNSNCKRGRKAKPKAASVAQNGEPQIITKIITKISNRDDSLVASATQTHMDGQSAERKGVDDGQLADNQQTLSISLSMADEVSPISTLPMAETIPASGLRQQTRSQSRLHDAEKTLAHPTGKASQASDTPQFALSPAAIRKQHKQRQDAIIALLCEVTGEKVVKSSKNTRGAELLAESDATDEEIKIVIRALRADTFWCKQMTLLTVAEQFSSRLSVAKMAVLQDAPSAHRAPQPRDLQPPPPKSREQLRAEQEALRTRRQA